MFRWYRDAVKCYVYLSGVLVGHDKKSQTGHPWESDFRRSKWFTRGWTLQELLAPASVEFFSREGEILGSKETLEAPIHEITGIPITALHGTPLSHFPVAERLRWAAGRHTKKIEDKAYCLLGVFGISMSLRYGEGDNAFNRLKEKINRRAASIHVHWTVTRPTNTLFTGRDEILQDLDNIIIDAVRNPSDHKPCRIVISGMGGQGKSEICLQLAYRLRQMFWGVFWIDVSTTSLAAGSFLDLAHKLSIPAQTMEEASIGIANLKHPWLLVLDNADDPDVDYQQYIPSGPLGVVALTSRNEECQQYATAKAIALEGLSKEEARELLLKAARVPQDQYNLFSEDAKLVAGLLQSHPLALIQAGAYVTRGHCTLAQYPSLYERQRQRLLAFRPSQAQSRYRDVYATFEASADILKMSATDAARDALQLLPLLAVCGPSRFPLPLFEVAWKIAKGVSPAMDDDAEDDEVLLLTPWHVRHLPSLVNMAGDIWDSFRLVEAVQLLKAFALVSTDSTNGFLSVSIHPLIHAWARDRQEGDRQDESWLQMACLVAFSRHDEVFWEKHERQLQSHVETLTGWEVDQMFAQKPTMLVARVLMNCGLLLHRMRSDTKLLTLLEKIFSYLKLDRSRAEQLWLGLYELAERNLLKCGRAQKSTLLLEAVVKIREQTLAEDHPSRLASQHTLATAYQANGQVKKAVTLLEAVVKIEEQTLAEDHPSRLASQHVLARAYQVSGQVKEAVALIEAVVKIKERTLVEDHPDRLASQHVLAMVYQANGQVKEAVALLEAVVKIKERTLVEDHPDRLASQHALAIAYQASGQVKEAVALLEAVVKIREQTLVKDHRDRLISQQGLAACYWKLGDRNTSFQIMKQVVAIQRQVLDDDHPDRKVSEAWLKYFEEKLDKLEPAESEDC